MDFKGWFKPRVLVSGVIGLLLAFAFSCVSGEKDLATTCRPSKETIWIDLKNTTDSFVTPVCKDQEFGWRGAKQFTVTFDKSNGCVNPFTYTLDQSCPGPSTTPPTKCSITTHATQPSLSGISLCSYTVGGGLKDPRVIVIGK